MQLSNREDRGSVKVPEAQGTELARSRAKKLFAGEKAFVLSLQR